MFVSVFLALAVAVISSSLPSASVRGPGRAPGYTPSPYRKQRDAIVRSLFVEHPTWTGPEVFTAVQPLLAAAGFKPIGFASLRSLLAEIRKELNLAPEFVRLSPEHSAWLKEEMARDPDQYPKAIVVAFETKFGMGAVPPTRLVTWWRMAHRRFRYTRTRTGEPVKIPIGPKFISPMTQEQDAFVRTQAGLSDTGPGFHEAYELFVNRFGPNAPDRATVQATWFAYGGSGRGRRPSGPLISQIGTSNDAHQDGDTV